jgi:arylformamidase
MEAKRQGKGMRDIDYETEYSPSRRVPEYLAILEGWTRNAAAYRAEMIAAERAALDLPFGNSERQKLDLFFPRTESNGALALFIHGGWWQMMDRSAHSHMARGLNGRGVTVAVTSYDLTPQVRVATIVEQMRRACLFLWKRHGKRLVVFGHSAGGHLTAAMAATDWALEEAPAGLIAGGCAISGAFDLAPLLGTSMNRDWKLSAEEATALSPVHWTLPDGVIFDAIVGALESDEFKRQSRLLADAWGVRYAEVTGANHFTVLDPLSDPDSAMVARLSEICARTTS